MADKGDAKRNRLISAVARRVSGKGLPGYLPDLARDLFARVGREDLEAYSAAELAGFVRSAAETLGRRTPGCAHVRLNDPSAAGKANRHGDITLVEIANDNMPFIVDSVLAELQESGAEIRMVAHPIVTVERDSRGALRRYHGSPPPEVAARGKPAAGALARESLVQVHVGRIAGESERKSLADRLQWVLGEVRDAVADWQPMRGRLSQAIEDYRKRPPPIGVGELNEALAFLEWLLADNFTFLGLREYDFVGSASRGELRRKDVPGLGILSDPNLRILRRGSEAFTTSPAVREFLMRPEPLIITKTNIKSVVHRRAYIDYVGIKQYRDDGGVAGELRLIGLFTSTAYTGSTREIPILRRKVADVLLKAGYDPDSHSGKALVNLVESYPRDELFQIDEETLLAFANDILDLGERPRIRVLVRPDKFDRFVSIIVFVPRDRYNSDVRARIGVYLAEAFDGHVSAYYPAFPEGMALARVHFIIGRSDGRTPVHERADLEAGVAAIARTWTDALRFQLLSDRDGNRGSRLAARYSDAFPLAYRDDYPPEVAVADIATFERLTPQRPIAIQFYREGRSDGHVAGLKLVHLATPIALSERVPLLEAMGFRVIDERSYEVSPNGGLPHLHVHDMRIETADRSHIDLDGLCAPLTECLSAVWYGETDNDGYNALVLRAGLSWREAALIRAISRFVRQAGTPHSQHYMWTTFGRHAHFARDLVALFRARFDPDKTDEKAAEAAAAAIEAALEKVESLDEDTIIRRFADVIQAMVRTNFFQLDGGGRPHPEISFKLDSRRIEGLPEPRPFREIFVHSPRVEGVHLRFGAVARGGLRWSDRPLDFRTEILGLVKAQQVKNAVIVPVGAKGGFVPHKLPAGGRREEIVAEATAAYRVFVSSLLDLTDNLDGDHVVPPKRVVRRDGDDPYLVVAADKGTATFSDIANGIADDHGFWLGDAFASGGSAGYDHKRMGITARGAWEAVKRHFREMDVDIQTTPFTVVGIGDMSGDVFGNGMLLSPRIKLVAAFDHRDIFIDPDPDPAVALAERRRLFALPRSSWQDYDAGKISAGGGVFSRRQKSIRLTREIKALLDVSADRMTPPELIRAILKAKADLLWFGGIGTYVRASDERDADVGDRSNDGVRITARDLRVAVVGEGANLGMTQRARIEFGLNGGRCNSDAIDNSAGVNTSDVEVNIKIALGRATRAGRLDLARRNRLLKAMTGDVAGLVLRNNYLQSLAISLTHRRGFEDFPFQHRLMQDLEARGVLDRKVETLPDDVEMIERQNAGRPLTRAEIGVLLAYAKIDLFDALIDSDVIDDPALAPELMRYFPQRMCKDYAEEIRSHRLSREIVATQLANAIINRGGPAFVTRATDRTGARAPAIARAFLAVREVFGLRAVNATIDALDNKVSGATQLALYAAVQTLLIGRTVWFLRHASFADGIGKVVETYAPAVAEIGGDVLATLSERLAVRVAERAASHREAGIPDDLALKIAALPILASAPDIHVAAKESGRPLAEAAALYFNVAEAMRVDRVAALAVALPVTDYYDGLALDRALDVLGGAHRRIVIGALAHAEEDDPLAAWLDGRKAGADHALKAIAAMTESEELTVSRVSVAANLLSDLAAQG